MAKIDVLLPVKNGIEFLAEAIDSIQAQTFTDWRLLVLDHGSTDGSREMAERYGAADPRVQVHSFPQAKGLSGLLNCGLDLCDCDYVVRHDADDICFPDRFALQLAAFARDPACVAIGGQSELINAAGVHTADQSVPVGRLRLQAACLFRNPVTHPTVMMDFAAVRRLGVRYGIDFIGVLPEAERIEVPALVEDYFLFGQLAVLGKVDNVPDKLIRYRWHTSNVSVTRFAEQIDQSLMVSRYLARVFSLHYKVPYFDPAPFCSHGARFFDVDGRGNFDREYAAMAATLRRVMGDSDQLARELDYRWVASTRGELALLGRYWRFRLKHRPETGEWLSVRAWLLRALPRRASVRVAAEGAA
jgi:glycosyltransferase involved in cell wall biosynthesis